MFGIEEYARLSSPTRKIKAAKRPKPSDVD
jgi:hypothetical protein